MKLILSIMVAGWLLVIGNTVYNDVRGIKLVEQHCTPKKTAELTFVGKHTIPYPLGDKDCGGKDPVAQFKTDPSKKSDGQLSGFDPSDFGFGNISIDLKIHTGK